MKKKKRDMEETVRKWQIREDFKMSVENWY